MAFVDDIKDLMQDTVVVRAVVSRDDYGVPTYGSGTSYGARLVKQNRRVRTPKGDEVVSTAHVWIAGAPDVAPDDQVELSDGTTPEIASVERPQDETGEFTHTKVFFI